MNLRYQTNREYIELLENKLNLPQLFAVVTWGCSGSTWFAKILNSHPDIFCLHAYNQHIALTTDTEANEGIEYLKSISISAHGYKLAGDIHGINRAEIENIRNYFNEQINVAILIRNPLDRLKSMYANMLVYGGGTGNYKYIKDRLMELNYKSLSKEVVLFAHSINMLNAIIDESKFSDFIIEMEKLNDKKYLKQTIETLSRGSLQIEDDWLENLNITPFNSHIGKKCITQFSDTEKELIALILDDRALGIYEEIGYSVEELASIKRNYS